MSITSGIRRSFTCTVPDVGLPFGVFSYFRKISCSVAFFQGRFFHSLELVVAAVLHLVADGVSPAVGDNDDHGLLLLAAIRTAEVWSVTGMEEPVEVVGVVGGGKRSDVAFGRWSCLRPARRGAGFRT